MKPPGELPEPVSEKTPGYFDIEVPVLPKESPRRYFLQLPPEYNPYRRYPMVVTLHGAGTTAEQQIDWWAGSWGNERPRAGRPPAADTSCWRPSGPAEHQDKYGYSAHEHAIVLGCFRDACRRFAVDTDRVFLSGHAMGGDAAWDIGLAHPDLWAGVIPVVAESDRFCTRYWENAKNLPFYLVCGELDDNRMAKNSRDLNRYLQRGYNTTVVEYLGRGHEHFYDEILRLFDWMGRFHRDFFPREFSCTTMREGDNFFWWVELGGDAAAGDGQSERMAAAPQPPTGAGQGERDRRQQPLDFDRGGAGDRLAGRGNARFQTLDEHPRQRPEDEQPFIEPGAKPGHDVGGCPHPRRPAAPVLGEVRVSDRPALPGPARQSSCFAAGKKTAITPRRRGCWAIRQRAWETKRVAS